MRILHVETGRHVYGGARQVLHLLQGLADISGCENILACAADSAADIAARGVADEVHALPFRGDLDPMFAMRLRRLLRRTKPDIMHVHSRRGADVWSGLAAVRREVRTVLSRRVDNPESRLQVWLKYGLYDRVIAISQGIMHVLLQEGVPENKLVCVPSGVDVAAFKQAGDTDWFRKEFHLDQRDVPVGVIAQFIPRKGHLDLLRALPEILREHPRTRLLLFGQGPLRPRIEREVAHLDLGHAVRFAGFRTDMEEILPCLRLAVHPARWEGLGVSLLQAAAAGVPIVASRAGGIPEIVRHRENGLLVPPGDSNALARAVCDLLSDTDGALRLGQSGQRIAEEEFSLQQMIRGNLQVYRELVQPDGT